MRQEARSPSAARDSVGALWDPAKEQHNHADQVVGRHDRRDRSAARGVLRPTEVPCADEPRSPEEDTPDEQCIAPRSFARARIAPEDCKAAREPPVATSRVAMQARNTLAA